jgi:hypothetical protein
MIASALLSALQNAAEVDGLIASQLDNTVIITVVGKQGYVKMTKALFEAAKTIDGPGNDAFDWIVDHIRMLCK